MKKLRYLYLGISVILTIGIATPPTVVLAMTQNALWSRQMMADSFEPEKAKDSQNDNQPSADEAEDDEADTDASVEAEEDEEDATEEAEEKALVDDEEDSDDKEEEDEMLNVISEGENGGFLTNIVILSYNPGFSDPYVGEFVELRKLPKNSISLAGLTIIYETSSGSEYTVLEFSEEHEMVGESLLLRLASSDEVKNAENPSNVADATYTRNMAQSAGRIKLKYQDEEIDSLCWGLKETSCYAAFKTGKKDLPTTLVRSITEDEVGEFSFLTNYTPNFDPLRPALRIKEIPEEVIEPQCRALEFTEIYTYFETSSTEQFVEIYNNGEEEVELGGCFVNYKGRNYALKGNLAARKYLAIYPYAEWGLMMTKNPTSSNRLLLVDVDGETVDSLVYYGGQKKGVSFAKFGVSGGGNVSWKQTYNVTAGAENIYQQFKTCPVGKVINLETGNCVNEVQPIVTLAACPEGKYRNPLTGRCKSYATTASTELKPCAEGYERNPETNRCRKIVTNTGADYPVATGTFEEKKELTSVFAIATVVVAGLGYIVFQYKEEIKLKFAHKQKQTA